MISKSSEEYLKTMYILKQQNGNIRVTDIAKKMNCIKPSVNKAIYNLKDSGLVNYESYGTIELTEKGEDLAKKILEAYDIVYVFLKDVLNLDEEEAERFTCKRRRKRHIKRNRLRYKKRRNPCNNGTKWFRKNNNSKCNIE